MEKMENGKKWKKNWHVVRIWMLYNTKVIETSNSALVALICIST
jgi:hypothetical protein